MLSNRFMKNNVYQCCFLKTFAIYLLLGLVLSGITGCGTTKKFSIQSDPEGALVIKHDEETIEESTEWRTVYCGETPAEQKVHFINDDAAYFFTAEKRGYEQVTRSVTKESDLNIIFDLNRIEDVIPREFIKDDLRKGTYILLPADVEVTIHSGVDNFDKKEYSPEMSARVTDEFNRELTVVFEQKREDNKLLVPDDSVKEEWIGMREDVKTYLKTLEPRRLKYYARLPLVNEKVDFFNQFLIQSDDQTEAAGEYYLYIYVTCVSETAGRKAGNVALSILASAAGGYGQAIGVGFSQSYYCFPSTSGTLVIINVIDKETSEVLYIEPIFFGYDITKEKYLKKVIDKILEFPEMDENKK